MLGQTVGNYEVLSRLGEGGMGAVYLARHRLIGHRVAIKVLLPESSHHPEMVQRFFNEARSTSAIKHAGLIDVFDFGYHEGRAFIAMELLEGESLAARLVREGRCAPELIAAVGRQVASAIGAAHARGIVHRDLKPDNIFLVPDDEVALGVRAKVLDFGIAKLSGDHRASLKTRTGSLMGTPAYMSPEQCRGAGEVDARSDIYSLGCILFEMATGRTPFVHDAIGPMMMAHMIEEPPLPQQLAPSLPESLEAVIRRAMTKDRDARYPSMEALAAALGGRTGDGAMRVHVTTLEGVATSISFHPVPQPPRRRSRMAVVVLGGIAVAGLVAAAIAMSGGRGGGGRRAGVGATGVDGEVQVQVVDGGVVDGGGDAAVDPALPAEDAAASPAVDAAPRREHRRKKPDAPVHRHSDSTIDPFAPPRNP